MKKIKIAYFLWMVSILMIVAPALSAQENNEPEEVSSVGTYLNFSTLYTSNDSVELSAKLTIRRGRTFIELQNAPITFSASNGTDLVDLGEAVTDSTGFALLNIPLTPPLPADVEGLISYQADFQGTDKYDASSEVFMSKPASLKVSFFEEDSIKYIRVTGMQINPSGEMEPIAEESVYLFVPSLFRPLPIGDIWLDEEGTGYVDFPPTIIGDSTGQILVIARIDEHDLYGFVKGEAWSSWAIPKYFLAEEKPTRTLWTPIAPLWMIITLIILLAGVWGHYIYAIIELVTIKRIAKENEY